MKVDNRKSVGSSSSSSGGGTVKAMESKPTQSRRTRHRTGRREKSATMFTPSKHLPTNTLTALNEANVEYVRDSKERGDVGGSGLLLYYFCYHVHVQAYRVLRKERKKIVE